MPLKSALARYRLMLVFAVVLAVPPTVWEVNRDHGFRVDLTVELIEPSKPTIAQLFCKSDDRYSGDRSVTFNYDASTSIGGRLYRFQADLPCGNDLKKLRFDPVWADGKVIIRKLRYRTFTWHDIDLQREFSRSMKILNSIRRFTPVDGGLLIESAGNDPFVELSTDLQQYEHPGFLVVLLVWGLATFGCAACLRGILGGWSLFVERAAMLEEARRDLAERLDAGLVRTATGVVAAARTPRPVNWLAWLAVLLVSSYGNWLFLSSIYSGASVGAALALLSATCQFQLVVVAVLAVRGALSRRERHAGVLVWWVLLLAAGAYMGDALLYRLNGMDLLHGARMLLDGGLGNLGRNIGFMKLPTHVLVLYELAIVAFFLGSFALAWAGAALARRMTFQVSSIAFVIAGIIALGVIGSEQSLGLALKSERLEAKEQILLPLYLVFRQASDTVLTCSADVVPFHRRDLDVAGDVSERRDPGIDRVYLVILEGVREDVIRPDVAPHLCAFQKEAMTFSRQVANGNATHYGWYSIVNSRFPLYWETYRDTKALLGSASLLAMKNAGFSIHVHTAKDLDYLQSKRIMFGDREPLFDTISDHPDIPPPAQDTRILDELVEAIRSAKPGERSMSLVFWDSTHYPYRWPEGMVGEFSPYVGTPLVGPSLGVARSLELKERAMVFNRYLNSTKFTDGLFGRFIDALKRAGLYERSVVVVVGDHGQQFMEHGFMMHGNTLYNEDIHVPLAMRVPGQPAGMRDVVACQLDIMPTILDAVGLKSMIPEASDGVSVLEDNPGLEFATSAAAGIQNTPSIFLLETKDWKLRFDLDARAPKESRVAYVKEVRTAADTEYVPGAGKADDYRAFVEEHFGKYLAKLGFVRVVPPTPGVDVVLATTGEPR